MPTTTHPTLDAAADALVEPARCSVYVADFLKLTGEAAEAGLPRSRPCGARLEPALVSVGGGGGPIRGVPRAAQPAPPPAAAAWGLPLYRAAALVALHRQLVGGRRAHEERAPL